MYEKTVARQNSSYLLECIDSGILSADTIVNMCINWMSEADVSEMMAANDLSLFDEVDEFEEE